MQTAVCKYRKWAVFVAVWSLGLVLAASGHAEETIADGKRVSLQYSLTLQDETVLESSVGKKPLVYTHGSQQIVPGLEKQLTGLKVGDTKKIVVSPEEGYGIFDPKRVQEVPKESVPKEARVMGGTLQARGPQGQIILVQVKEVKEKTVILDLNHPLAGQTLFFAVKVLKVEAPESHKIQLPSESSAP